MKRPLCIAVLALLSWFVFGAKDALWARQDTPAVQSTQGVPSTDLRLLSPGTKLTVHLKNGTKIEGVLREVQNDLIVMEHKKGGKLTTIPISDIQRLQTRRDGLHPVARTFIVVGATLGALVVLAGAAC